MVCYDTVLDITRITHQSFEPKWLFKTPFAIQPKHFWGITVFKMFICGGISSVRCAVKCNFWPYNRWYTSPNENLNMVIPILMHFLTFICYKCTMFCAKQKLHQQRKTTLSTNHKWRHLWCWCSDGIAQNILTQILEDIQSDVALHSQVHYNTVWIANMYPSNSDIKIVVYLI